MRTLLRPEGRAPPASRLTVQLKLFILPLKNLAPAEQEMNGLLRSHRVLAVKKEFVPDGENSFWTFCVEYLESPVGTSSSGNAVGKGPKVDYREVLNATDFALFSRLRDFRKTTAEKEAVPVYAIFTNDQLAEMVKRKAKTKAALREIEGVGESRVEKHGEAVLALLNEPTNPVPG